MENILDKKFDNFLEGRGRSGNWQQIEKTSEIPLQISWFKLQKAQDLELSNILMLDKGQT